MAAGEILGIAGVSGNGQYALAEALAGLTAVTAGDVVLGGASIAARAEAGAIPQTMSRIYLSARSTTPSSPTWIWR